MWSILLGLKDQVKFLHEHKKASLNYEFLAKGQNWKLYPADYANSVGFIELGQYLQDIGGLSVCEQTFRH